MRYVSAKDGIDPSVVEVEVVVVVVAGEEDLTNVLQDGMMIVLEGADLEIQDGVHAVAEVV